MAMKVQLRPSPSLEKEFKRTSFLTYVDEFMKVHIEKYICSDNCNILCTRTCMRSLLAGCCFAALHSALLPRISGGTQDLVFWFQTIACSGTGSLPYTVYMGQE